MLVRFWGARGSFAVQGKKYLGFGGATSCASIEIDKNKLLIIDAGTGIKDLGYFLSRQKPKPEINLFLTHFHLDHIMGLPSFQPLYEEDTILNIYSPLSPASTRILLDRLMGGSFFPLTFSRTASQKKIYQLGKKMQLGEVIISSAPLPHPGGNLALRFEKEYRSIVFATDAEPPEEKWEERVINLAWGATYLVGDAMFTPREYAQGKKGRGHASWRAALKLAREAGCSHLVLSHWNPDHDDQMIRAIISRIRKKFFRVYGARPGWQINL